MTSGYLYQIRHRVRRKIEALRDDLELLEDHQPDLAQELYDAIAEGR